MASALTLFSGPYIRAEVHNPDSQVLVVTFDHWRRDRAGFPVWAASQTVKDLGFAELVIRTSHNDWFINPDLEPLRQALDAHTGRYRTVRCLTFSMGGFGALLLSQALRLRSAILVSPQWSIFPDTAPYDRRYETEAAKLDRRNADLASCLAPKLRGVVLFDPRQHKIDEAHARLICDHAPGMKCLAMPFGGHPASRHLVEAGGYKKLRTLALEGKSNPRRYRDVHKEVRDQSELYVQGLQAYLLRRMDRVT